MKCPECNYAMDYTILEKRGEVWICDYCGKMADVMPYLFSKGTADLDYPIITSSTKLPQPPPDHTRSTHSTPYHIATNSHPPGSSLRLADFLNLSLSSNINHQEQ